MKKHIRTLAVLGVFLFMCGSLFAEKTTKAVPTPSAGPVKKSKRTMKSKALYVCPMHPEVRSDKPGKCPKCGMDLEKAEGKKGLEKSVPGEKKGSVAKPSAKPEDRRVVWTCPMCGGAFDKPGKCPECGMDLVQKK